MHLESNEIDSEKIKHLIHLKLQETGLYDKINQIVNRYEEYDEQSLIKKIKEEGLLDSIKDKIKIKEDKKDNENKEIYIKSSMKLKLTLVSVKGFLDYDNTNCSSEFFRFDILFFGQRFKTRSFSMTTLVNLNESLVFNLNTNNLDVNLTLHNLKKINTQIHFVLIKFIGNEKKIISTKSVEWRLVLCNGYYKITTELYNIDTFNKTSNGLLELDLNLIDQPDLVTESSIREQLKKEKKFEKESKILI